MRAGRQCASHQLTIAIDMCPLRSSFSSPVMPLHTLGVSLPNGRWGITFGDVMSIITAVLYFWQPGIDHQAVMQWVIDHAFLGSVAACSIFGTFVSHKLFEWGGMGFYAALYWLESFRAVPGASAIAAGKIDPSAPWDWEHTDKKVGAKYSALQLKSIFYILKYHAVVCIVQFLIFTQAIQWTFSKGWVQWDWIKGHPELSRADPATIPSKATVAYQCLVSTFVAETGFYWVRWTGSTAESRGRISATCDSARELNQRRAFVRRRGSLSRMRPC